MADLLKNMYNYDSLRETALLIQSVCPSFQADAFLAWTLDETWERLELKERVRKISTGLGSYLPAGYQDALAVLDQVAAKLPSGFFGIILPDFVEVYGQQEADFEASINALARYTVYSSSEFAVRPFIIHHETRMIAQMYAWSKHENEHLRRLASEGCRPQLPWGQALVKYKKDPAPVLPILEQLKADPSPYVRKSVANNLNDISKTHPDLIAQLAKDWYGKNEYTNWIIKHGCRTLLKKGNPNVLSIFGFHDPAFIHINHFSLSAATITLGEDIIFLFSIVSEKATKVRLEYGID